MLTAIAYAYLAGVLTIPAAVAAWALHESRQSDGRRVERRDR